VLLSGDNAIVIALACRSLPAKQRLGGMVIGTAVALVMRLGFASIVSSLMLLPYIKIVGGAALLWIDRGRKHGSERAHPAREVPTFLRDVGVCAGRAWRPPVAGAEGPIGLARFHE